MGPCEVELTQDEMLAAAIHGVQRNLYNLARGAQPRYGAGTSKDWQLSIDGSLGEMAVAKWLGVFWHGSLGNYDAKDVGGYQVRTSGLDVLSVRTGDKDEDVFICVHGVNGRYVLRGWIYGREGKLPRYYGDRFNNGRPNYWIPFSDLHPMETLPGRETTKPPTPLQQLSMIGGMPR